MADEIYLDIQGFVLGGKWTISEIAWLKKNSNNFKCYNFHVEQFNLVRSTDRRQLDWCTYKFHGLTLIDGTVSSNYAQHYLKVILDCNRKVYCRGEQKINELKRRFPAYSGFFEISNIPGFDRLPPLESPIVCEVHNNKNPIFYKKCALYKIFQLKRYVEEQLC